MFVPPCISLLLPTIISLKNSFHRLASLTLRETASSAWMAPVSVTDIP